MNRTKLLTIAVLGLLLINLGTLLVIFLNRSGHHPRPPHEQEGPRGEGPKRIIIERLNFDEAQQKQYEEIIVEHRKKMRELNDASRDLHNELFGQLTENVIDKAKADSVISLISLNQKALDNLNFDHFQKIKGICKPGQIEQFNDLVKDLTHLFSPQGPPPGGPNGPPHGPPGNKPE